MARAVWNLLVRWMLVALVMLALTVIGWPWLASAVRISFYSFPWLPGRWAERGDFGSNPSVVRPASAPQRARVTPTSLPGGVVRYVAPRGDSSGDGSRASPFDLETGLSRTQPGDTLIVTDGVYRIDDKAGLDLGAQSSTKRTSIIADSEARPIITAADGTPPVIRFRDNTRVEGLWFGGIRRTDEKTNQSVTLGNDGVIAGNTFFGYYGAINEGSQTRNTIRDNRFVNTGGGRLSHAIYINNFAALPGEGALIEGNIFVGGEGYATHLWHDPKHVTIRGNFYGDVQWAIVAQGQDILCERNLVWSSRGTLTERLSVYLPSDSSFAFRGNLIGPRNAPPIFGFPLSVDAVISENSFVGGARAYGDDATSLTLAEASSRLGVSADELDGAISGLEKTFAADVEDVHNNADIERLFATLHTALDAWAGSPD